MKARKKKNPSGSPSPPASTLSVLPGVSAPVEPTASRIPGKKQRPLDAEAHVEGILQGDRVVLGRTITLIESVKPEHNEMAMRVMERILPHSGKSVRIGITGVPGVGKSTFIETLGTMLTGGGHKLAVLAIDPSSTISKGSIMGDKTRMETLSADPNAFIRPSPSAGSLGGVARKTREAMLVCEAAGYDVIFVETVGVGQSETVVHSMVDFFLLLLLANAGDELQGIKRGIMELADAVAINKADGDAIPAAARAKSEFEIALHLMRHPVPGWTPPVLTCSSRTGAGVRDIWEIVESYCRAAKRSGAFEQKRRDQNRAWMFDTIGQGLRERFERHPGVATRLGTLERAVGAGELSALLAARELLDAFFRDT